MVDDDEDDKFSTIEADAGSDVAGEGESGKRRMPSRLGWKQKSPNVTSMPSWRASKAMLKAGECVVKSTDPKQIELIGVEDPKLDDDETGETVSPARAVPTDGANYQNIDSADPLVGILGFRVMRPDARW